MLKQSGRVGSWNPGALQCPGRRVHTRGTSSTSRSQHRLALPLRADRRQLPGTRWLCPRLGWCGPVTWVWMLKGAEGTDRSILPHMPVGPREASLSPFSHLLLLHSLPHCCPDTGPEDTVQPFWGLLPAFRLLKEHGRHSETRDGASVCSGLLISLIEIDWPLGRQRCVGPELQHVIDFCFFLLKTNCHTGASNILPESWAPFLTRSKIGNRHTYDNS